MARNDSDAQLSLDVDEGDLAEDVHPDSTVTWGTDWTVGTIVDQLRRGRFDLEPAFQRRDVWSATKRSRFIESLLLGIPVPQVILAERRDSRGRFIVLDGKQRLRSLQRFAGLDGPPMKLTGLEVLTHLNGLTYEDLLSDDAHEDHTASLDNAAIRAVVLRGWANESLLYLTFLRLNSNVVGLSPQELRRALHPGPFMDYVMQASTESGAIRAFLGNKAPDFRMRDAELLTRHIALTLRYDDYRGDLRKFMDDSCQEFNEAWHGAAERLVEVGNGLDLAIETTITIFGRDAFRRYSERGYESRKNRAVLDVMAFYFQHRDVAYAATDAAIQVKAAFEHACREVPEFQSALTSTTKSVASLNARIAIWGSELGNLVPAARQYIPRWASSR
jgi:hypothetical protein